MNIIEKNFYTTAKPLKNAIHNEQKSAYVGATMKELWSFEYIFYGEVV